MHVKYIHFFNESSPSSFSSSKKPSSLHFRRQKHRHRRQETDFPEKQGHVLPTVGFSFNNFHNDDVTDGDNDDISEPI